MRSWPLFTRLACLGLSLIPVKETERVSGKVSNERFVISCLANSPSVYIQLFRERLSEKVHATISKGIVGGFEFTVLQRNLREWHEKPWISNVCEC